MDRHILSSAQFTGTEELDKLIASAEQLRAADENGKIPQSLAGKIIATLFFEPSTRTRLSFEAAALKLGAQIISTENAKESLSFSAKGETLQDTIRIVNGYADAIVLRHHEKGGAAAAAEVSSVPIINAGDGSGEHPTQALGDIYTIQKERGRVDGLKIALMGDLLYGRTVHSLLPLLSLYKDTKVYLVSPEQLRLPDEYKKANLEFKELQSLDSILTEIDVLYVTRIQKERFGAEEEYKKLKGSYVINAQTLQSLKKDAIIMHPLPRVDEIASEVDADPRAAYFRQAKNGLYLRMALLAEILS